MTKKLVYDVGINDLTYKIQLKRELTRINGARRQEVLWTCPYYIKWKDMLCRCYSEKFQAKRPSYRGCLVAEQWLYASNFKAWMEQQDWEGKHLDKDLLGDGTLYSPEKCVFISESVNTFLKDYPRDSNRLAGVTIQDGKFIAACNDPFKKRKRYLGSFSSQEDAHLAWKSKKHQYACELAETEKDVRIIQALVTRYI